MKWDMKWSWNEMNDMKWNKRYEMKWAIWNEMSAMPLPIHVKHISKIPYAWKLPMEPVSMKGSHVYFIAGVSSCPHPLVFHSGVRITPGIRVLPDVPCKSGSLILCKPLIYHCLFCHVESQIIMALDKENKVTLKYWCTVHFVPRFTGTSDNIRWDRHLA